LFFPEIILPITVVELERKKNRLMLRSEIAFLPLAIFLFSSMITPGPNNITGASMGLLQGYRKSYKFVLGVAAGFFIIMLLSGLLSGLLLKYIPGIERIVRLLGALYILWMAIGILRSSMAKDLAEQPLLGFSRGLLLQFLNPKVMVVGLTLYSSFLASIASNYIWLVLSAAIIACFSFTFTSIWTMAGSILFQKLKKPILLRLINSALAVLLVYTAYELSGVKELIHF
jgi:cysteine/O-acetylserine efflux protein